MQSAQDIARRTLSQYEGILVDDHGDLERLFSAAIASAIAAEREACAKIADEHARLDNPNAVTVCDLVSRAIRARGKA